MVFWDDLVIAKGTNQGIFSEITGPVNGKVVKVEYRCSKFGVPHVKYHFQMMYTQAQPNVAVFTYFEVGDAGKGATIGLQGREYCSFLFSSQ